MVDACQFCRASGLLIQLSLRDLMNESSRMTGAGWCQTSISRIIVISLWNSYKSEELTRNDQPYLYLILALRNPTEGSLYSKVSCEGVTLSFLIRQ